MSQEYEPLGLVALCILTILSIGIIFNMGYQKGLSVVKYDAIPIEGEIYSLSYDPYGHKTLITFLDKRSIWINGYLIDIILPSHTYILFVRTDGVLVAVRECK